MSKEQSSLADPTTLLHRLNQQLVDRYGDELSPDLIERLVAESYATLSRTARVKAHLLTRTERFAKDRVRALIEARAASTEGVRSMVFVGGGNAGPSQMAALIARELVGDSIIVRSAGVRPDPEIDENVLRVLAEEELDASEEYPKPITDDIVRASDIVITMGCPDAVLAYPGKRYEDWEVEDPRGLDIIEVRRIRDDIRQKVTSLVTSLTSVAEAIHEAEGESRPSVA